MPTTEAITEELNDHLTAFTSAIGQANALAAVLRPGQSTTVYSGVDAKTFKIQLIGTIQRNAKIEVSVDDSVAATLTFDFRATIANGRAIRVANRGRDPQGVLATLVA